MFFVISIDMKSRNRLFYNQKFSTMKTACKFIRTTQKSDNLIHAWKIYMILPYTKKCPISGKEKIWKLMKEYF